MIDVPPLLRLPLACLLTLSSGAVQAQTTRSEIGVGYVANAPELMLGVTVHGLRGGPGGLGGFVDVKLDIDSPGDEPNFLPGETAQQVAADTDDTFFDSEDGWFSVSAGVIRRAAAGRVTLYAGAGYTMRRRYSEYRDPSRERGLGGFYWVEDPEGSGGEVNVLAGLLFAPSSRLRIRMGGERAPGGVTLAGIIAVPVG